MKVQQKNVLKVIEALRNSKREHILDITKEASPELLVLLTIGGSIEGAAFVRGAMAILMLLKFEEEDKVLQELEDLAKLS